MASKKERAANGERRLRYQTLRRVHHRLVVGVRPIQLEHRKLGIVGAIDSLVPEVLGDLVYPVELAHDQAFEIQLVRDSQVQGTVERVVVRRERSGEGSPVQGLQDGRLHLYVAVGVQKIPQERYHAGAREKDVSVVGVHGKIRVALAIPGLRVREAAVHDRIARLGDLHLSHGQRP
jgi:hypothetical protein